MSDCVVLVILLGGVWCVSVVCLRLLLAVLMGFVFLGTLEILSVSDFK